ncbi:MAG: TerB family tellurite resistance protein [Gammaproteobacteria bacterium]
MLRAFLTQLGDAFASPGRAANDESDHAHALRLATAALAIEVARSDHSFDETELAAMLALMAQRFDLTESETQTLADDAETAAEQSVSVYEFTQTLHEKLGDEDKAGVMTLLWQIAYADGRLDKYENSLVLKISDLMFVPRGLVMRLKHDAAIAAGVTPPEQRS